MLINKSIGVTNSEKLLISLCENTFLRLWCYPNLYNDSRKELCDLLAIFENHVFIFFDRTSDQFNNSDKDIMTLWNRWKNNVIQPQIKTAQGVERYIKNKRTIYLDAKATNPFPFKYDAESLIFHKIIVAHGAKEACLNFSNENINGSLAITYSDLNGIQLNPPFYLLLDKNNPIHVFDSHNLQIILNELDTFYDFKNYIVEKERAINSYKLLSYCGEEDLLAYYFLNFDQSTNRNVIIPNKLTFNGVMVAEGMWNDFIELAVYKEKKVAEKISYFWDELIQETSTRALANQLGGNSNLFSEKNAIYEMAKEPRHMRRILSEQMIRSIENFPKSNAEILRNILFISSFFEGTAYVFLQLQMLDFNDYDEDYRAYRLGMLEVACGATKNKFKNLKRIVGIAMEPKKYYPKYSVDFSLLECEIWSEEQERQYEKLNETFGFYKNSSKVQEIPLRKFPRNKP